MEGGGGLGDEKAEALSGLKADRSSDVDTAFTADLTIMEESRADPPGEDGGRCPCHQLLPGWIRYIELNRRTHPAPVVLKVAPRSWGP
jgi:hypothetical protein